MKKHKVTQEEKDKIMDKASLCCVTLNGEPAKIYGKKLDYPIVAQINGNLKTEFSWKAVDRRLNIGGDFEY